MSRSAARHAATPHDQRVLDLRARQCQSCRDARDNRGATTTPSPSWSLTAPLRPPRPPSWREHGPPVRRATRYSSSTSCTSRSDVPVASTVDVRFGAEVLAVGASRATMSSIPVHDQCAQVRRHLADHGRAGCGSRRALPSWTRQAPRRGKDLRLRQPAPARERAQLGGRGRRRGTLRTAPIISPWRCRWSRSSPPLPEDSARVGRSFDGSFARFLVHRRHPWSTHLQSARRLGLAHSALPALQFTRRPEPGSIPCASHRSGGASDRLLRRSTERARTRGAGGRAESVDGEPDGTPATAVGKEGLADGSADQFLVADLLAATGPRPRTRTTTPPGWGRRSSTPSSGSPTSAAGPASNVR